MQVIQSKCISALLYGLEACPTNKPDRSLDFVLDRFFMKLFRTSNVAIVIDSVRNFLVFSYRALLYAKELINLLVNITLLIICCAKYVANLYQFCAY